MTRHHRIRVFTASSMGGRDFGFAVGVNSWVGIMHIATDHARWVSSTGISDSGWSSSWITRHSVSVFGEGRR